MPEENRPVRHGAYAGPGEACRAGTPGCPCVPVKLAGAGKASLSHAYANCALVSRRALAAALAWWWQGIAEWKKGQGPQWRNE